MQEYTHPSLNSGEQVLRFEESALYEEKIRRLEDSVSSLRLSRRILMSLLEQVQSGHKVELERLSHENRRLRRQLSDHAQQLWQLNISRNHEGQQ
jgi:hypothetical protein